MAFSFFAFPATLVGNAIASSFALVTALTPATPTDTRTDTRMDTTSALDTAFAHITTDTGDYAPGRTTFSRYNTPQLCLAATRNANWLVRRDVASQLVEVALQQDPLRDTLPTAVVSLARQCATTFSVNTTSSRDLHELMQLALVADQDSMAAQVVARQLSSASSAAVRDSVLLAAMNVYLMAQPTRLAAATALVDRVVERGDAGRRWQLGALTRLLDFSIQIWDTASTTRFAQRIIDTINATPHAHRAQLASSAMDGYRALAAQAYLQSPDSVRAVALRAQQTWRDFATPLDTVDKMVMAWDAARSAPVDEYMRQLSPVRGSEGTAGVVYPPLQASYWYPAQPSAGVPRLIMSNEGPGLLRGGCLTGELELLYGPAQYCMPFYERLRRLAKQYGPRLQIVLVTVTHGNAIRSLPLSPAKEAERLKWYLLDYLKLPVTLAVVERPVGALPAPDRRQWRPTICELDDPETDSSATACKYLRPDAVLLNAKGESVPLWGPQAQQDLIIERQVSQWNGQKQ